MSSPVAKATSLSATTIRVTTSPGEAVIERCRDNLDSGHRPVPRDAAARADCRRGAGGNVNLADRIALFEIEQFTALNLYELGKFAIEGRRTALMDLAARYNEIIDKVETDPSLRIEFRT
jgi:hypothetical protein